MVEFRLFFELSARNTSVFYFQDNNLSKSEWIFTKFDVYIDSALGLLIGSVLSFNVLLWIITKKCLFKYTENFTIKKLKFSGQKF